MHIILELKEEAEIFFEDKYWDDQAKSKIKRK
jgi:hypothetical protein